MKTCPLPPYDMHGRHRSLGDISRIPSGWKLLPRQASETTVELRNLGRNSWSGAEIVDATQRTYWTYANPPDRRTIQRRLDAHHYSV